MRSTICVDFPNSIQFEIRKYVAFSAYSSQPDHKITDIMALQFTHKLTITSMRREEHAQHCLINHNLERDYDLFFLSKYTQILKSSD